MWIKPGDMVDYRTRDPQVCGTDIDKYLRTNYATAGGKQEIWRPAIVMRVWGRPNDKPALNLLVLPDGEPLQQMDGRKHPTEPQAYISGLAWRTSVPYIEHADHDGFAWRLRG